MRKSVAAEKTSFKSLTGTALFFLLSPLLSGCGGESQSPGATTVSPDTFTVQPSASSVTVYPGSTQTMTVALNGTGTTPVTVGIDGLPSGVTVTSSPSTALPNSSVTLTLSASPNADAEAFPATAPTDANSASSVASITAVAGTTTVSTPLTVGVSLSNTSFSPTPAQINLPILKIDTGGASVISTSTDVDGTVNITSADGAETYLPSSEDSDNTATFHVHGNTTSQMPKLPYEMKLGTSVDLLGLLGAQCAYVTSSGKPTCDKSKTYILLANYDDKSLLRDWAASALANAIPYGDGTNGYLSEAAGSPTPSGTSALLPWAPHSVFVELFLNGQYEGNYQLMEKVNVDSHRVNIPELSENDVSDDITGGYLVEIDAHQDEAFVFTTPRGIPMGLIDPNFSPDPEVSAQTTYISQYVDGAEDAMFASNYTDPKLGWRGYFDEASLVNFYIVNEVMGNVDGGEFYSSDYFYKTAGNPLLYMGPVWDFDISAGNVNYQPIVSPLVPWMRSSLWYSQLFTDPGFAKDMQTQWNALKKAGVFSNWVQSIQQQSVALNQSAQNNFTRWPMIGETVWPNPSAQGIYSDSVGALTDWINQRIGYLDAQLNAQPQTSIEIVSGPVAAAKGATLNYKIRVQGTGVKPTGSVKLLLAGHAVADAELDALGEATITTTSPIMGNLNIMAVYGGDHHYAASQVSAHRLPSTP